MARPIKTHVKTDKGKALCGSSLRFDGQVLLFTKDMKKVSCVRCKAKLPVNHDRI